LSVGQIRLADRPGDVGEVIALHGRLYAGEYGLDATMEGFVALGLGEWVTGPRAGPGRLWAVDGEHGVAGAIGITAASKQVARLRWFLLDASLRGRGLGRALLDGALAFARESGYERVVLETFSELVDAAALYRAAGFERVDAYRTELWGRELERERYELSPLR
jgi:GNAT superfamily N-acetyltransferase